MHVRLRCALQAPSASLTCTCFFTTIRTSFHKHYYLSSSNPTLLTPLPAKPLLAHCCSFPTTPSANGTFVTNCCCCLFFCYRIDSCCCSIDNFCSSSRQLHALLVSVSRFLLFCVSSLSLQLLHCSFCVFLSLSLSLFPSRRLSAIRAELRYIAIVKLPFSSRFILLFFCCACVTNYSLVLWCHDLCP